MITEFSLFYLRSKGTESAQYLRAKPDDLETHKKVADVLYRGTGGKDLVEVYIEVLDALNPTVLEDLLRSWPQAKVNNMIEAFLANPAKFDMLSNPTWKLTYPFGQLASKPLINREDEGRWEDEGGMITGL